MSKSEERGVTTRRRVNSLGSAGKTILKFCTSGTTTPTSSKKRNAEERSPRNAIGNANKKASTEQAIGEEGTQLTEVEYISMGMERFVEEMQKLNKRFDEEREDRNNINKNLQKLIESMQEEAHKRNRILDVKIEALSKKNEEREARQEEIEKRLEKIESLLIEKVGEIEMSEEVSEDRTRRQKERDEGMETLNRKMEETERQMRRNNIMITGLKLEGDNLRRELEDWIGEKLKIQGEIKRCWVIKGKVEMIGAECESETMKRDIFLNKKELKGTRIYIENDLTFHERSIRRNLKEIAKKEIEKGRKAFVRDKTIIIEGEIWKWN